MLAEMHQKNPNKKRAGIAVAVIVLAVHAPRIRLHAAGRPESRIRVRVDSRIELMATIFRLAGNPEYGEKVAAKYVRDVEENFGPLIDHPAVRMAATLRTTRGIAFDAPMTLALHVTEPDELREAVPFDPKPYGLDPRWRVDEAREFLAMARDFAKVSGFEKFFAAHKDVYTASTKRMEDLLESCHLREWFEKMFGEQRDKDLVIVVAPQLGGNNYGIRVTCPGESEAAYAIKGIWQVDEEGLARFSKRDAEVLVHEFCHSFANRVIDANIRELREPAEALYAHVAFDMAMQSYGRPDIMLYESLVRALVIRYLREYSTSEYAEMIQNIEMNLNGFLWMRELVALLESFESNRTTYPDLESFGPRIVDFFRDYAKGIVKKKAELEREESAKWKGLEAEAPRILSMVPKNGDMNVDPGLKEMTITFDRPVRGIALMQLGRSTNYPLARQGWTYDATGTILTVPLQIRPDSYYTFGLNAEKALFIQDRDGHPLVPVVVKFKTRKAGSSAEHQQQGNQGAHPGPDGTPGGRGRTNDAPTLCLAEPQHGHGQGPSRQ